MSFISLELMFLLFFYLVKKCEEKKFVQNVEVKRQGKIESVIENKDINVKFVDMYGNINLILKKCQEQKIKKMFGIYVSHNSLYRSLEDYLGKLKSFISRNFDKLEIETYNENLNPKEDIIGLDGFYVGKFGTILFNSLTYKKPIYWKFIEGKEKKNDYIEGIEFLESQGWKIKGVVMDIMFGLKNYLEKNGVVVQYCIFHQKQIIKRYLTTRPKLEANKQLLEISKLLGDINLEDFYLALETWYNEYNLRLKESNINGNFIHLKTIKAYKSLLKNAKNLYSFEKYPNLNLPKTNNFTESMIGYVKNKLKIHRGLKDKKKKSFISYTFLNRGILSTQKCNNIKL